ncbi:MAG TPA: hypothetical protein VM243_20950 [Phycisphaerae bacterium]|nr:hypothetical protein [Phycisphaerae bacterium]
MAEPEHITEEQLLDYLLEQCDEAEAARIATALEADPHLAATHHRLADALRPLDAWVAPDPPQAMVGRILDGIAAQNPPKLVPAASTLPPEAAGESIRRPLFSLRELVALAACITLFVGVLIPMMSSVRFNSRRQGCANNLASLYGGLSTFSQANEGQLPFNGQAGRQRPLGQRGQRWAPNRDHLFPLVQQGHVARAKLSIFLCPERKGDEPMSPDMVDTSDGFADPRNCSYDVQYMSRPVRLVTGFVRPVPLLGDASPLFEGGRFHRDVDPERANSTSHRGVGQNLLLLSGSVIWQTTPVFEPTGDNIYQAGQVRDYAGTETPVHATDTFLVP